MKRYTIIAVIFPIAIAACFTDWTNLGKGDTLLKSTIAPKRHLLEMGYNPKAKNVKGDLQSVDGYTIDAIYVDGQDTVSVKGISQEQYDSLDIAE